MKLAYLYDGMSQNKRDFFKQRLLSEDRITPVLTETDTAFHFLQLGYDIEWVEAGAESGKRSPDFLASREEKRSRLNASLRRWMQAGWL